VISPLARSSDRLSRRARLLLLLTDGRFGAIPDRSNAAMDRPRTSGNLRERIAFWAKGGKKGGGAPKKSEDVIGRAGQRPECGRDGRDGVSRSGKIPNFGLYSAQLRRGCGACCVAKDKRTGIFGATSATRACTNHGFACWSLAEAYGGWDDSDLWSGGQVANASRNRANCHSVSHIDVAVRGASRRKRKPFRWLAVTVPMPKGRRAPRTVAR